MTPSELKQKHQQYNPDSFYFSRDTMRFFGDTMRNYGTRLVMIGDRPYWELWRKTPVKHGKRKPAYFDLHTFELVHLPHQV